LLDGFSADALRTAIEQAYGRDRFAGSVVAPLTVLSPLEAVLELWHGPTAAFKDVALQLLPHIMLEALRLAGVDRRILILVATSGDTGKAALEGFRDVQRVRVTVFYPSEGVSDIQRLQMVTQQGHNVNVFGVHGDFDDAQTGVKRVFGDAEFNRKLAAAGCALSSANSINWGRLAPQIVYYISAYCEAVACGAIKFGDKVNFVVPSGNFGNILAAYYAMRMGLPVNRLVCASNKNNVLADFFNTGVYDRRRTLHRTTSPSMDILVSSNLERLLFEVSERDDSTVQRLMSDLQNTGQYSVGAEMLERLQSAFWGGWCDEPEVMQTISDVWSEHRYVLDPHTAVGQAVYEQYLASTGDDTFTIVVSTASPFKFPDTVVRAIAGDGAVGSTEGLETIVALERLTGVAAPKPISDLASLAVRHPNIVQVSEIPRAVASAVGLT
jgi:threonine synthase